MDFERALGFVARDREPGARLPAAGNRAGGAADARFAEPLGDLAEEVRLALPEHLHAIGNVHGRGVYWRR